MSDSSNGGIGFTGALTILFIGLKLADYIDWSWWWVLSPIWITTGLGLIGLALFGIYVFVEGVLDERARSKRAKQNAERLRARRTTL